MDFGMAISFDRETNKWEHTKYLSKDLEGPEDKKEYDGYEECMNVLIGLGMNEEKAKEFFKILTEKPYIWFGITNTTLDDDYNVTKRSDWSVTIQVNQDILGPQVCIQAETLDKMLDEVKERLATCPLYNIYLERLDQ